MARMVGPKRPGPAPLPKGEKQTPVALVRANDKDREALEAWAERERRPLASLLRDAGLKQARRGRR